MDPNANLREQLELAQELQNLSVNNFDGRENSSIAWRAEKLAELVLALDEWIRKGGFLPDGWAVAQKGA